MRTVEIIIITLFSVCLPLWATAQAGLRICLPQLGCLQGTHLSGDNTTEFEAYMGIPFAQPPLGELRFKNPQTMTAWPGNLDATRRRDECLQKNYFLKNPTILGTEDCLYLNIYRPKQRSAAALPVLFYIHGGGFLSGSPHTLEPDFLMATKEVIMITIGYRLGPFGFLSTGDAYMPGNFGLKDQRMALSWVQTNIEAFGGDPNCVTIFGHSIGGSSVHLQMLSEGSRGLFQRAVSFSGNALMPMAKVVEQPLEQTHRIAKSLNISSALGSEELVRRLRRVAPMDFLYATESLKEWFLFPLFHYGPVVEAKEWTQAFLTEQPVQAQANGHFTRVPWLIGTLPTAAEGTLITLPIIRNVSLISEFNANSIEKLGSIFGSLAPEHTQALAVTSDLWATYTNGVQELNNETLTDISTLFGDYFFSYPFYRTIQSFASHTDPATSPLYVLMFDYRGAYSYSKLLYGGIERDLGVMHMDDSIYLFNMPSMFPAGLGGDTPCAKLAKRFVRLLIDFAKTGHVLSSINVRPCTAEQLTEAAPGNICDYLTFGNSEHGFQETIRQRFDVQAKRTLKTISGF